MRRTETVAVYSEDAEPPRARPQTIGLRQRLGEMRADPELLTNLLGRARKTKKRAPFDGGLRPPRNSPPLRRSAPGAWAPRSAPPGRPRGAGGRASRREAAVEAASAPALAVKPRPVAVSVHTSAAQMSAWSRFAPAP